MMIGELFKELLEVIAVSAVLGCTVYYGLIWLSDYRAEKKRKEQAHGKRE